MEKETMNSKESEERGIWENMEGEREGENVAIKLYFQNKRRKEGKPRYGLTTVSGYLVIMYGKPQVIKKERNNQRI